MAGTSSSSSSSIIRIRSSFRFRKKTHTIERRPSYISTAWLFGILGWLVPVITAIYQVDKSSVVTGCKIIWKKTFYRSVASRSSWRPPEHLKARGTTCPARVAVALIYLHTDTYHIRNHPILSVQIRLFFQDSCLVNTRTLSSTTNLTSRQPSAMSQLEGGRRA